MCQLPTHDVVSRVRIESQYADSLQTLYIKTRAFDSLYDEYVLVRRLCSESS